MGANAVVIVADHSQVVGRGVSGAPWARLVNTFTGRVIVGMAIRYRNHKAPGKLPKPKDHEHLQGLSS